MMRIILLTFFSCFFITANAQFLVGIKTNNSISTVKSYAFTSELKYNCNPGLTIQYKLNKSLVIASDILYANKGFKTSISLTDMNGNATEQKFFLHEYKYLSIPLKLGLFMGEKKRFNIQAGFSTNFLLTTNVTPPKGLEEFIEYENLKLNANNLDFGFLVEFGYQQEILDDLILTSSIGLQHGVTTFTSDFFGYNNPRHMNIYFDLGLLYSFNFGNK